MSAGRDIDALIEMLAKLPGLGPRSARRIIDAIATTQVRAGQVIPITQNEKAIEAIVPMSLVYERP